AQHTKQRADRQARTKFEPRIERLPCPTVHPDLTPPAALPVLCRGAGNAEFVMTVVGRVVQGWVGLGITLGGGSQAVEEGDEAVGGAVATGSGVWRSGAVDRSLFEAEVAM